MSVFCMQGGAPEGHSIAAMRRQNHAWTCPAGGDTSVGGTRRNDSALGRAGGRVRGEESLAVPDFHDPVPWMDGRTDPKL